jgi:multidrug efflux pump subunit AcrB
MRLVYFALSRPVTILVAIVSLALASALAVERMPVDIFPALGDPAVYVAQPYGGMDPAQMDGFLTYYYEYHFLYITGIEHIESKSIQGAALMKLVFHPGTDMNQAMAQVVGYVNRARAFMPPGAVPPFITRFDAGSVPIGQLVFSSAIRQPGEMQDFALNRVRPLFATLPGVSAPPPFGGNQRTIVVRLDPERLRAYRVSPEDAIAAVNRGSTVVPSGNIRIGDLNRIASTNAVLGANLQELMDAPVRVGSGPTVYLRDLGVVENGTDIVTAYAHVNGRRTVYIPVTKRSDASTLAVIAAVKEALPRMKAAVPEDVDIRLEFDQSRFVRSALLNLVTEGVLGALLSGLVVLLFLRDWRSAVVVVATIPTALMAAAVGLWLSGQTLNLMSLGGLALAVGVLVDEATVTIEQIHARLHGGSTTSRGRAIVDASRATAMPRLLAMLSILAVFVPSFFMTGVARQLFVPLSLAVGFAMIASYVLSSTLVPVLSGWLVRASAGAGAGWMERFKTVYASWLSGVLKNRTSAIAAYAALVIVAAIILGPRLGTEIFPSGETDQFQIRLRAATGTRIERTEILALEALDEIKATLGDERVQITTSFVGVQPASYPINTIYLWTSGPHEAVLLVALKPGARKIHEADRELLRERLAKALPGTSVSFEAGDIISQVMSFGAPTPVEVAVQGASLQVNRDHAEKIRVELAKIPAIRDLQFAQPLDYPTLDIAIDRERAGQFGLTMSNVARSLLMATSSSRFVEPNYWRDPVSGNAFQIQVEIPQAQMASTEDLSALPLMVNGGTSPQVGDVATIGTGTAAGLVERYNGQRVVSLTANLEGVALGQVIGPVRDAIGRAGEPPRGVSVVLRGQVPPLEQTESGLRLGLLVAVGAIFLLLAAYFQSLRLAIAVLSPIPAVIAGVVIALAITGTTLNVQSFMGAIMALGIAVANAILLVAFAEERRRQDDTAIAAALAGGTERLRAILMTATAMIAGMLPMAFGLGEGGGQAAPLGRAVIGGLAVATIATLTVVPVVYSIVRSKAAINSSLNPEDPGSRFYDVS